MSLDFCLGCGVLLSSHDYECPACGFDNSFGQYNDISIDDSFLEDLSDDFIPEEDFY